MNGCSGAILQRAIVELLYTAVTVAFNAGEVVDVIRQASVGNGSKALPNTVSTTEPATDSAGPYVGQNEANVAASEYVTKAADSEYDMASWDASLYSETRARCGYRLGEAGRVQSKVLLEGTETKVAAMICWPLLLFTSNCTTH